MCPAGYAIEGEECVKCKAGSYSEGGDWDQCLPCPAGTTSFDGAIEEGECFVPRECAWGAQESCDAQTGCSWGCHENYCWSQCNGVCPRLGDLVSICHGCKEWCWLAADNGDYTQCSQHSDCQAIHRNSCASACTY